MMMTMASFAINGNNQQRWSSSFKNGKKKSSLSKSFSRGKSSSSSSSSVSLNARRKKDEDASSIDAEILDAVEAAGDGKKKSNGVSIAKVNGSSSSEATFRSLRDGALDDEDMIDTVQS